MRESLSISLSPELKREVDRYSDARGVTRSDVVREALREYLFVRRFRDLRKEFLAYGEAAGLHSDEDVFREVS
jgi:metal-responsive CopG/Arc/MetJ family transcriptional regulator